MFAIYDSDHDDDWSCNHEYFGIETRYSNDEEDFIFEQKQTHDLFVSDFNSPPSTPIPTRSQDPISSLSFNTCQSRHDLLTSCSCSSFSLNIDDFNFLIDDHQYSFLQDLNACSYSLYPSWNHDITNKSEHHSTPIPSSSCNESFLNESSNTRQEPVSSFPLSSSSLSPKKFVDSSILKKCHLLSYSNSKELKDVATDRTKYFIVLDRDQNDEISLGESMTITLKTDMPLKPRKSGNKKDHFPMTFSQVKIIKSFEYQQLIYLDVKNKVTVPATLTIQTANHQWKKTFKIRAVTQKKKRTREEELMNDDGEEIVIFDL